MGVTPLQAPAWHAARLNTNAIKRTKAPRYTVIHVTRGSASNAACDVVKLKVMIFDTHAADAVHLRVQELITINNN